MLAGDMGRAVGVGDRAGDPAEVGREARVVAVGVRAAAAAAIIAADCSLGFTIAGTVIAPTDRGAPVAVVGDRAVVTRLFVTTAAVAARRAAALTAVRARFIG